eukprot:4568842-Pyramimonas_sp.AAC.1
MVFLTQLELQMSYSCSAQQSEVNHQARQFGLELQMSCRAVRHSNRNQIIRRASSKYLDA